MKIGIIRRGELKNHLNESANRLGYGLLPIILFRIDSNMMNAGTFFIAIYITSSALEKLDQKEQYALIDHELGHSKRLKEDLLFYIYLISPVLFITYTIYNIIFPMLYFKELLFSIPFFFIFLIIRFFRLEFMIKLKRQSEFGSDRISGELGNATALISSLKQMEKSNRKQTSPRILKLLYTFYFSNRPFYPSVEERIIKLEELSSKLSIKDSSNSIS